MTLFRCRARRSVGLDGNMITCSKHFPDTTNGTAIYAAPLTAKTTPMQAYMAYMECLCLLDDLKLDEAAESPSK